MNELEQLCNWSLIASANSRADMVDHKPGEKSRVFTRKFAQQENQSALSVEKGRMGV